MQGKREKPRGRREKPRGGREKPRGKKEARERWGERRVGTHGNASAEALDFAPAGCACSSGRPVGTHGNASAPAQPARSNAPTPARNGNRTVPNRPALMCAPVGPLPDSGPVATHRAHPVRRNGPGRCEVKSGNGKLETRPARSGVPQNAFRTRPSLMRELPPSATRSCPNPRSFAWHTLIPDPSPPGEGSARRSVETDAKIPSPAGATLVSSTDMRRAPLRQGEGLG